MPPDDASRRRGRPARLHQGYRGAAARGRAPARAPPGVPGPFHVSSQLAAPSRTVIERYRQLNDSVEQLADRINARFAKDGYRPIVLLRAHHEPPTVFRYLRAADVCYVSSLHDGMNLVAKEFVAARDDERGVLVLIAVHGRRARADRGADRESLRPRGGERGARDRARHVARGADAIACVRCARSSPSSTSTAGLGGCSSMPRVCAAAIASREGSATGSEVRRPASDEEHPEPRES